MVSKLVSSLSNALLFTLLFQLSGCSLGCKPPPGNHKLSLNVGYIPIAECAHLYVALDQKYFDAENLEIHLVPMAGGAAILPRLENGSLDIGFTNVVSVLRENEKNSPSEQFVSLGASSYESGHNLNHALLVRADSSLHSIADLRQRSDLRIALNTRNNIEELELRRFLEDQQVEPARWHPVTMPFPEMLPALDGNRVDVAAVVEPFIVPALAQRSEYRMLARQYEPEKGDTIVATYAVTRQWLSANPAAAESFRRAMSAAARFMEQNDPQTRTIIAKYTHITENNAQAMGLPSFRDSITKESFEDLSKQLIHFQLLTSQPKYEDLLPHGH
jgi:NitT/TauT family transport system substrate-binding protein